MKQSLLLVLLLFAGNIFGQTSLPVKVDWTSLMPPPVVQGNEGSCTAFAATYALAFAKNYVEGFSDRNRYSQSYLFSLYVFNLDNGGDGSSLRAVDALTEAGCVTIDEVPYNPGVWTQPSLEMLRKGLRNKASDYRYFPAGDSLPPPFPGMNVQAAPGYEGINKARALLANGKPVMVEIDIPLFANSLTDFPDGIKEDNYTYTLARFGNYPNFAPHFICVVGYDDTLKNRDGKGSFLVIDSRGPNWFNNGYWRLSYEVLAKQQYRNQFYTFNLQKTAPEFTVELQLENFGCACGSMLSGFIKDGKQYSRWIWKYRGTNPDQEYFKNSIVDMTELARDIDFSTGAKFFIQGDWRKSLWSRYPVLKSIRFIDTLKSIDTTINANITITDSVWYAEWDIKSGSLTGVSDKSVKPKDFHLDQNFPNPFNPTTQIMYSLPEETRVSLKVYDLLGRDVKELVNEAKSPGSYSVDFDCSNLSSGTYIYVLRTENFTSVKKMMLVK